MKKFSCFLILLLTVFVDCKHKPEAPVPADTTNANPPGTGETVNIKDSVCFEDEIRPILISNCAYSGCHDDTTKQSGISLYSYQTVKSTISGNLLMQIIQDPGQLRMPPAPNAKLSSAQIQLLQTWVNEGMKQGIDCLGPCDTASVTFSGTINPIIQNSCIGCHGSGSTTDLSSYSNVLVQVNNGKLDCAVNHSGGCQPMPQNGPKLSLCKLKQIKIWIDAGAPNN
jgi:hypothetical protein